MRRLQAVAVAVVLAGGLVAASLVAHAQQQQQPAAHATGTVQAGVTAVLVDVVVRDKHGMPVRDLQQSDFEVVEDGVAQTIGSFTPIFEELPAPAAAAAAPAPAAAPSAIEAPAPPKPAMRVPITALVFDRLSPEARQVAMKAAKTYLGDKKETPNYMGVFGIDLSLKSYTSFTRNAEELRKGIDGIDSRASASFGIDKERLKAVQQQADAAQNTTDSAAAGGGSNMGSSGATAQLADMEARMLTGFEVLERDQAGYSQVNSLYAMIEAMRRLPGRKSIVLFSEGVSIPPAVQRLFLGVIDAANRANVSIYTMDAAGLRATSTQAEIRDEVNATGNRHSEPRPQQRGEYAADEGAREERGRAAAGSAHGPRRARTEHRRSVVREHEQPAPGLRADRHRPSQLLPRRLHARQPDLRRQVPEHRGQGQAAGCNCCRAQGLLRRARHGRRSGEHVGSGRARRARFAARSECVSVPGERAVVPWGRQARAGSGRRQPEDGAHVISNHRGSEGLQERLRHHHALHGRRRARSYAR